MPNRTIVLPGVWARDATDVPVTPIALTTYRDTALSEAAMLSAWPYTAVVNSATFNEMLLRLTFLMKELETNGVLTYSELNDYVVGAVAKGTDNQIYQAGVVNGPGSSIVDPVGDVTGTWNLAFSGGRTEPRIVTASTTVAAADRCIVIDATAGNVILTLLAANDSSGQNLKIQRARGDVSANTVEIEQDGADTIALSTDSLFLFRGEGYELIPDGVSDYLQF